MGATIRVVRFGLGGLIVKGELGSGLSVADSELEAPSSGPRSRGELKYSRTAGRIGLTEAKGKEGSGVEQDEKKSLREDIPLDKMTRSTVSLVVGSKGVSSAFIEVSSGTAEDMFRLGSKEVGAKEGIRAIGEARATATVGMIGGERVGFLRTENKEKRATGEEGGSSTKGVLSRKSVSSKAIKLSASISRSIWSMIEGSGWEDGLAFACNLEG